MYRYLDQNLNQVNGSVKYILWAMRAWVDATARQKCPKCQLKTGLSGSVGKITIQYLHLLMSIFQASAPRQIKIRILPCCQIGEDEALLLAAFTGLEKGNARPSQAVFGDMLDPTGASNALKIASRLMKRFQKLVKGPVRNKTSSFLDLNFYY